MDSISDKALRCGAELIVHTYQDGQAPGTRRLKDMQLKYILFSAQAQVKYCHAFGS